jgi:ppGpp synthetase/RelA/SpoT-type nucleotidyltranferase
MTEDELIELWTRDRPMYEAWGQHVVACVVKYLRAKIAPLAADIFVRIPPKPRLKGDASLLEKAFYRKKGYADPYADITDKVGVRFVVLLSDQIRIVEDAITDCPDWDYSKDRDYEEEQRLNPIQFDYAAVHYIVRCRGDLSLTGIIVRANTPCEIQVKTILQHAYSELTHDTIHKPKVDATPLMLRTAAKSMALIEATNDYFQQVIEQVDKLVAPTKALTEDLAVVYRERVGREPELTRAEGLVLDAYEAEAGEDAVNRLRILLDQKAYLADRVRGKAASVLLYRQPSILLVYLLASDRPTATKQKWPLTPDELRPVYVDLGLAFDSY